MNSLTPQVINRIISQNSSYSAQCKKMISYREKMKNNQQQKQREPNYRNGDNQIMTINPGNARQMAIQPPKRSLSQIHSRRESLNIGSPMHGAKQSFSEPVDKESSPKFELKRILKNTLTIEVKDGRSSPEHILKKSPKENNRRGNSEDQNSAKNGSNAKKEILTKIIDIKKAIQEKRNKQLLQKEHIRSLIMLNMGKGNCIIIQEDSAKGNRKREWD